MFLHGWGCDHKTLMPFINKLKKTNTCVCFDFYGFGRSKGKNHPLTIYDYKNGVVNTLKKLGFDRVNILAHSFGARVAFLIASEKEIEVEKMFLIGPAGIKPKFSFKKFFKIRLYKLLKFLSKIKLYSKKKLDAWGSSDYKKLSPVMKQTFQNVIGVDEKKLLPQIDAKTFVAIGENDMETPVYMGRIMQKKMKNCRLEIIKGAGHFCFLEKNEVSSLAYYFFK